MGADFSRRLGMTLAGGALAVAVVVACYAPTEVRLQITTDRACVAQKSVSDTAANTDTPPKHVRTLIEVGSSVGDFSEQTDTGDCNGTPGNGDIGSLVLVPRGARDAHVTVQISMTVDGSDPHACNSPTGEVAPQCIVTRRSFSFIEHTSRVVPIRLYQACKGKTCGEGEGCEEFGLCKFADLDRSCVGDECDAGAPPGDAAAPSDAAADHVASDASDIDAGAGCSGSLGNNEVITSGLGGDDTDKLAANSKYLFWTAGNVVRSAPKSGGPMTPLPVAPAWGTIAAIAIPR